MGLSSKQVSSDRNGWNQAFLQELPKPSSIKRQPQQQEQQQQQHQHGQQQQQQQQQPPEALKCPRCDSANTKFCYYNNYNKSQPRHFCKACKRHWTKGGTLRNVPVGGGRKNKRLKTPKPTSKPPSTTTTTTTTTAAAAAAFTGVSTSNMAMNHQARVNNNNNNIPLEHKSFSEAFYKNFLKQNSSLLPESSINFNNKGLNDGIFMGISQHHDHHEVQFPYLSLGSFESNPCSISSTITSSVQSPNMYNFTGETNNHVNCLEENVINNINNSSSMSDHQQQEQQEQPPWTVAMSAATTNSTTIATTMDMSSNWGWDDFDKFVSVDADLTMPWDDADIKP